MVFSEKLAERYRTLKQEHPDCILVMQVGAFMQVMDEDARRVSAVTGLKLSMAGQVDAQVGKGCLVESRKPGGPDGRRPEGVWNGLRNEPRRTAGHATNMYNNKRVL